MAGYLITNARVLDGSGQAPFAGAVRVEANRITEVTPGAAPPPARGATVIDAAGATLMPGLVESHAHLGFADMTSQELTRLPPEEHMLVTVRNAKLMLDCGYTSAFSAASPKARLDVVLKREIEAGRVSGPRLLANGPQITVTGAALGITYHLSQAAGQWGITAEGSAGFERELAVSVEVLGKMRKRGIRVLPGGDYGFPFTPHGTYARDLWIFVKILGFSAMDTLVAATRLGGELMGMPGELGVIKPGALADLLLVAGGPLADIAVLQDRHALRVIMKDGALHKAPEKGQP